MATTQTMWVLQWERYTSIAKSQNAPPQFWIKHKEIKIPKDGQVTEREVKRLKEIMKEFNLEL